MDNESPNIQCPKCKKVSYHTDDIKHKYCGFCNEWHEFMETIISHGKSTGFSMENIEKVLKK